jgi:hypothetical protein
MCLFERMRVMLWLTVTAKPVRLGYVGIATEGLHLGEAHVSFEALQIPCKAIMALGNSRT